MNYEEIVEYCINLRRDFERDEAKFFLGLVEIETNHMHTLIEAGVDTFDSFLRSCEFTRTERYRKFAAGLKHTTTSEALQLGAPAVMQMAHLRDVSKAPEYKEAVLAWSSERKGLVPTLQTAAKMLRQIDPRPERPQSLKNLDELHRLQEENIALRREVARLRRELDKIRKEGEAA